MLADQTAKGKPHPDILDRLWRIASGQTAQLVLLALLTLSLLLGSLLPQLSSAEVTDPALASRWLSSTAARYGAAGMVLRTLGLLDIAHALWFRLLLALLAFHLLLRAAEAARMAWTVLSDRRPAPPAPPDLPHATSASLLPPLPQAAVAVRTQLAASGLRVLGGEEEETATGACLYADRARLGVLAPVLANVGALLLLWGLFINSGWGWQTSELLLAPGQESALQHDTGLSLRLEKSASTGSGQLLFLHDQGETVARPLALARPARYRGIGVYQTGDGPALLVRGEDETGQPLSLQPLTGEATVADTVSLIFDQPQAERHFTVPERNLALRVVVQPPSSADQTGQPSFLLEAYQGGNSDPLLTTSLSRNSVLEVGGARFELTPERYRVLRATRAPGLAWLLAGGLFILLAAALPLIWPALQVWAELIPERRAVAVRLTGRAQGATIDVPEELAQLARALEGSDGREE